MHYFPTQGHQKFLKLININVWAAGPVHLLNLTLVLMYNKTKVVISYALGRIWTHVFSILASKMCWALHHKHNAGNLAELWSVGQPRASHLFFSFFCYVKAKKLLQWESEKCGHFIYSGMCSNPIGSGNSCFVVRKL